MKQTNLKHRIVILSIQITIACSVIKSEYVFSSQYANSFLEIGIGARALGMGGSVCSHINDGTAFFWNPAGLALIEKRLLSGMYGPQFGTIDNPLGNFHFIGLILPLSRNAAVAFNWIRLSIDEIPVYSELTGNSFLERLHNFSIRPTGGIEGYISDTEDAFFFSFSRLNQWRLNLGWEFHRVRVEIPFGVNLKWIRQSLGDGQATGLGVDFGTMIRFFLNDFFMTEKLGVLAWGIHLQDLTRTTMNWNTKWKDSVPVNIRWGISYQHAIHEEDHMILISFDHESRWLGRNRLGFEYKGYDLFSLRVGMDEKKFSGGVGFQFWKAHIDYAYQSHELGPLHRISCSLSF